jgi:hydrogenase/urease accessory protein HupE
MGCEHLLGGADHLLFVLGLALWLRAPRRLLAAVTGFTAGHSATLSLATLGWLRVPAAPVELAIAASLFWLATKLAAGERGIARSAWRMAAALGLLHGLGFAGALAQAGLPAGEIPLALVAFNLGIELAQLGAVAALLAARAAIQRLAPRPPAWLAQAPAYAIGTLAAALVFERALTSLY